MITPPPPRAPAYNYRSCAWAIYIIEHFYARPWKEGIEKRSECIIKLLALNPLMRLYSRAIRGSSYLHTATSVSFSYLRQEFRGLHRRCARISFITVVCHQRYYPSYFLFLYKVIIVLNLLLTKIIDI